MQNLQGIQAVQKKKKKGRDSCLKHLLMDAALRPASELRCSDSALITVCVESPFPAPLTIVRADKEAQKPAHQERALPDTQERQEGSRGWDKTCAGQLIFPGIEVGGSIAPQGSEPNLGPIIDSRRRPAHPVLVKQCPLREQYFFPTSFSSLDTSPTVSC